MREKHLKTDDLPVSDTELHPSLREKQFPNAREDLLRGAYVGGFVDAVHRNPHGLDTRCGSDLPEALEAG